MVFEQALNTLAPTERAEARRRLTWLAASGRTGSHVEQNLSTESRLPISAAIDILNSLSVCLCERGEMEKAYKAACYRHALKGPLIKGSRPAVLGRAISKGRFQD